jgi:hypothetical protein
MAGPLLAPNILASTISRATPRSRLASVAAPISPAERIMPGLIE